MKNNNVYTNLVIVKKPLTCFFCLNYRDLMKKQKGLFA